MRAQFAAQTRAGVTLQKRIVLRLMVLSLSLGMAAYQLPQRTLPKLGLCTDDDSFFWLS